MGYGFVATSSFNNSKAFTSSAHPLMGKYLVQPRCDHAAERSMPPACFCLQVRVVLIDKYYWNLEDMFDWLKGL